MSGRIVEFARGADVLFVEACFLDEDRGRAEEKYHLTAGRRGDWPGLPG
jgi:ribonuclease Z